MQGSLLLEAHELIHGDRQATYGHPLENHACTAEFFTSYLRRRYGATFQLDAEDVPVLNALQKLSRQAHERKDDNPRDVAGYMGNLEQIKLERARRRQPTSDGNRIVPEALKSELIRSGFAWANRDPGDETAGGGEATEYDSRYCSRHGWTLHLDCGECMTKLRARSVADGSTPGRVFEWTLNDPWTGEVRRFVAVDKASLFEQMRAQGLDPDDWRILRSELRA